MVPLKNVGNILLSFQQFVNDENADAQLILIGNRDNVFINMAAQLEILNKNVQFKGEISYEEVASEMQKAHCLILNSSYETFSCVVAEALCCGLPVISTKVGIVPEVISNENGIQINSQEELATAMKQLYRNQFHYNRMKISQEAKFRFNYEAISHQLNRIYHHIKK
jgi:glycosyltransferase involved in cell wall biosynthesis